MEKDPSSPCLQFSRPMNPPFKYFFFFKVCFYFRLDYYFATKTTRGVWRGLQSAHVPKCHLYRPQCSIPCNWTVSNGWLQLFPPLFTLWSSPSLYISKMKRLDVGPMCQWGVVSGSALIERQLWLAWRCRCKRILAWCDRASNELCVSPVL